MSNLNNYPVDAFPSVLRDVINALHEDTLIPVEMIGSTVLAALSLSLQPLIDVASPFGNKKPEPCSLYFLILAKSGEGKSPLRELLMAPFEEFASELHEEYEALLDTYKKDHAIWSSKEKALNRNYQKAVKMAEKVALKNFCFVSIRLLNRKDPELLKFFMKMQHQKVSFRGSVNILTQGCLQMKPLLSLPAN